MLRQAGGELPEPAEDQNTCLITDPEAKSLGVTDDDSGGQMEASPRSSLHQGPANSSPFLQSRASADNGEKDLIHFSEKILWAPSSLLNSRPIPRIARQHKRVLNLASYDFTGLAGNETVNLRATETLRKYGVGSCSRPGFYGTIDVPMDLERDTIAKFLGTEASIPYPQGFSIPCVAGTPSPAGA
ncbi:hypothetical protein EI94DRAFT_1806381 [Lactarius quietus]|nr:hypothetical protein EI94DRAFT_1806381 [Lactarius quietus]